MINYKREAGTMVEALKLSLQNGLGDIALVPGLVVRILTDGMWREWTDTRSERLYGPYSTFEQFVTTPASRGGLGLTMEQLAMIIDFAERWKASKIDTA
jgi:hypothetical protein